MVTEQESRAPGAIRKPAWFDLPPDQWPPEARIVYGILALGAERLLKAEAEQQPPVSLEERMEAFLVGQVRQGAVKAHRLDSHLATRFDLSLSKASAIRRRLGFVPAFKGGPIGAPKEDAQ